MIGMRKTIFFMIVFSLFTGVVCAEVTIETSVSRSRVPVGGELTLDIIVNNADGQILRPTISSIEGFSSYSQGHSQELSIINGRSSSRSIFSYTLIANSPGQKTIGPFRLNIHGKNYEVAAVQVEVTQGAAASQGFTSAFSGPVTAPPVRALPSGNLRDQDIFVKAWVDKDEVLVNEPVMLTYTLYTRLSATYKGFEKEPVTTGFWIEDFPPAKTIRRTEQILNGARYVVAEVRKVALFPTEAGVFTVDPGVLAATVEVRDEEAFDTFSSGNIFGYRRAFPPPFMSQIVSKALSTDPVTIGVKVLPEAGKPASFTGAVGHYEIQSTVDKTEVEEGIPVTLRVRIAGQGNINTVKTPALPKMEDFKVYESSSSTNISKERLIVEGEKITETLIVPKRTGTFTIPALAFSYFDPKTRSYQEIRTEPHTLTVTPAPQGQDSQSASPAAGVSAGVEPVEKEDVPMVAKDIRYIETTDDGKTLPPALHRHPLYWTMNFVLLAAWITALWAAAKRREGVRDTKGLRFRRSHALAKNRLRSSARLMKEGKIDEFYAEISKTAHHYFSGKLDLPLQTVSAEAIERRVGNELAPELYDQIRTLFDELAVSRFGKAERSHQDMKRVYDLADRTLTSFERVKLK